MVGGLPVWVCADAVDFRLGIDGLALRVQASLRLVLEGIDLSVRRLRPVTALRVA